MRLQYLTDNSGNYTGVFIPIKDWEILKIKFKDFDFEEPEPTKEEILEGLKEALIESKLHSEGKIKLQTAKDFLNEL